MVLFIHLLAHLGTLLMRQLDGPLYAFTKLLALIINRVKSYVSYNYLVSCQIVVHK